MVALSTRQYPQLACIVTRSVSPLARWRPAKPGHPV